MRWVLPVLLGLGCAESDDETLSRLTRAWAVETAEEASSSMTSTTLLAALSATLCWQRDDADFLALQAGDLLPMPASLRKALGRPDISEVSTGSSLQLTLSGVDILDRTDQWLRITGVEEGSQYSVELDALIDDGSTNIEVARLSVFGQLHLSLEGSCTEEQALARGKALWIDSSDRRHDVAVPADAELGGDLSLGGDVPYLPSSGSLGWSARVEGQERSVTTEDAGEIRVDNPYDPVPTARWPVVARGPGWSGTAFTELAP